MLVVWTENAKADLAAIFSYIIGDDPGAAEGVLTKIDLAVSRLEDQPKIGRPGRVHQTRELVVVGTPYIVVYEIDEAQAIAHVLTVRHGARLWPEAFK